MRALFSRLYFQVLVAIVVGAVFGFVWPEAGAALRPLGDVFVKAIRMMIAPVVFCTIANGIGAMGEGRGVGRTLVKTLLLFCVMTTIALVFGLTAVFLTHPGAGMNIKPSDLDTSSIAGFKDRAAHGQTMVEFLAGIVPDSFFGAFAEGSVLPVLLLAVLVGLGASHAGKYGALVTQGIEAFGKVVFEVFRIIMKFAPVGAGGAIAFTVGRFGLHSLASLGKLMITFYSACALFIVIVPGTLAWMNGFSLWRVLRYFREELLIVLGTSSGESALPSTIQKLEQLGCKRSIAGLVFPLGYSFNLDGIGIYLTLGSVFIAQACNVHLSASRLATMLVLMLVTTSGGAGVTGSGFVTLVATLTAVPEIPAAGVALLISVDRFMSLGRALTSTMSNMVATLVIALWEDGCDLDALRDRLSRSPGPKNDF